MKRSSPSPASREQPTISNENEPIASTSGSSTHLLSDLSLELSKGTLSQAELAKIAQEMLSQLRQTSASPSSRSARTTKAAAAISSNSRTRDKRTITCIELSSDGEEGVDKKRQKRTTASSTSHEPIAGPSSAIDFQDALSSDVDAESDEESDYDHIHAGYDIHNPDIVRTLIIITASV